MEYGLSLGTNIENRIAHLRDAKSRISGIVGAIIAQSMVYETEPVDVAEEHKTLRFLNAVLIVTSARSPADLNAEFHSIEAAMGRVRGADRNAPRPIDIDIIYAGNMTIHTDGLEIPHPRWSERRFVVQPLADVRPGLRIPGQDMTVRETLLSLNDPAKVVPFAFNLE